MTETTKSATWGMIRLGRELRLARETARMSIGAVQERLGWSKSAVSRVENAKQNVTETDVATLLGAYGVSPADRDRILAIARTAGRRGWWAAYGDAVDTVYVEMEDQATEILIWDVNIPPFFHTAATAREQIRAVLKPSEDELERRVRARVQRRLVLSRDTPPIVTAVIAEEGLVRAQAHDQSILTEQIDTLLALPEQVTISVVPLTAPYHAGLDGPFAILRFADPELPPRGYVDGAGGGIYIEDPPDVSRLEHTFATLQEQARTPEESRQILQRYRSADR